MGGSLSDFCQMRLDVLVVVAAKSHDGVAGIDEYHEREVADAVLGDERAAPAGVVAIGLPAGGVDGFANLPCLGADVERIGKGAEAVGMLAEGLAGVVGDDG